MRAGTMTFLDRSILLALPGGITAGFAWGLWLAHLAALSRQCGEEGRDRVCLAAFDQRRAQLGCRSLQAVMQRQFLLATAWPNKSFLYRKVFV